MADDYIGWWAFRPVGKAHRVESHIGDRYITHCGRQLAHVSVSGGLLAFTETAPWNHPECLRCAGKAIR